MNRKQLVKDVADRSGLTQEQVDTALSSLTEVVTDSVKAGDKVVVPGFVSFERVERAARSGRNPQTGEAMEIPAQHAVKVSAGKALRVAVRKNR
jgi:DNA-binding protein HU-beta